MKNRLLSIVNPEIRGFSARNIWNMKNFYEFYSLNEKLQPLVAEIVIKID